MGKLTAVFESLMRLIQNIKLPLSCMIHFGQIKDISYYIRLVVILILCREQSQTDIKTIFILMFYTKSKILMNLFIATVMYHMDNIGIQHSCLLMPCTCVTYMFILRIHTNRYYICIEKRNMRLKVDLFLILLMS